MRKVNPNDVVDDFETQIDELSMYFARIEALLVGTPTEKGDISLLAEQCFVVAAVAFEGFLSDLFVAMLNRDSSKAQTEYENRVRQSVTTKFGGWHANRVSYSKTKHIKVADVHELLDPDGWNKTFKDMDTLKVQAGTWLIAQHAAKFNVLSNGDGIVFRAIKAIRNVIAHRSAGAKKEANELLAQLGQMPAERHLGRGAYEITNVGAFLKTFDQNKGERRLTLYSERTKTIAESLRL